MQIVKHSYTFVIFLVTIGRSLANVQALQSVACNKARNIARQVLPESAVKKIRETIIK